MDAKETEEGSRMFPAVRVDLMRAALTKFELARQKYKKKGKPWSGKALEAVSKAVRDDMRNITSYDQRCHAFRKMLKGGVPKALEKWVLPDGSLDLVLIDAAALAPLRRDGKFRIKEFRATVENMSTNLP